MSYDYKLSKNKNGLSVVKVPLNTASVTLLLLVGAGSRYEKKDENGISHFLEHMAFKGTKKRPTSFSIASAIEEIGGEFNAFTSKDHTAYWVKAAGKHLPLLLDVISDMALNSLLKEEEIRKEKGVIIEEINMYEDTPMRKIETEFEILMYGDTPLGRDIAGRKEVIQKVRRTNFTSYMNRLYKPNNAVLAIAGGGGKIANGEINRYFSAWEKEKVSSFEKMDYVQDKPKVKVVYKKTEQAHLNLGFPALKIADPRRYALSLLTIILGGGMASRLFLEVREKRGLAYYIRADGNRYADCGNFIVSAGIDTKRLNEAVRVIVEELNKASSKQQSANGKELKRAKEHLKGGLILSLEDSRNVAGLYGGSLLLEGKIRPVEEIIREVDKVTVEEVNLLAEELFNPKKSNLAVIGPYKGIDGKLKSLLK